MTQAAPCRYSNGAETSTGRSSFRRDPSDTPRREEVDSPSTLRGRGPEMSQLKRFPARSRLPATVTGLIGGAGAETVSVETLSGLGIRPSPLRRRCRRLCGRAAPHCPNGYLAGRVLISRPGSTADVQMRVGRSIEHHPCASILYGVREAVSRRIVWPDDLLQSVFEH